MPAKETVTVYNLLQRINAIRGAVIRVAKDANVDGRYQAVTHDAVTRMLRPLMVEHGVMDSISLESADPHMTGTNWGKRELMQYRGTYRYTVMNVDDPEDAFTIRVEGYGDDNGDKAPGKALSYAHKYARLKMFSVETGDDDEQRIPDEQLSKPTLTSDQFSELYNKAQEYFGKEAGAKLKSMAANVFQIEDSDVLKIESAHFQAAINALENQHKRQAA